MRGARFVFGAIGLMLAVGCRAEPDLPLTAAAAQGDTSQVQQLLAQGVDVNATDGQGWNALMWAARFGHSRTLNALLDAGADPDRPDQGLNGWTPLMFAIHTSQYQALVTLLDRGADPNARATIDVSDRLFGGEGTTPLIMAAGYGYTNMVQTLLARGADPFAQSSGVTALDVAVEGSVDLDRFTLGRCQAATVRALLDTAPDLKLRGGLRGWLALRLAEMGNCTEVLQLVQRG